ncbi:MAG TPA: prepilin peptidase [Xanthobacteraceae bacterium]|nr:prepilin peptidase [Xanthobacteraceae bacterium]
MVLDLLVLGLFPGAMAFAAASDLLTMKISNRLSLGLALAFFPVAYLLGMPPVDIGYHVLASAVVLGVCFSFFAMGWIGGGDAKLAAATALWFGFAHLPQYLFLAAIIGGILTLLLLKLRRYPLPVSLVGTRWIERLHAPGTGVPYGIALAAAALLVYPKTPFIQAIAG